MFRKYICPKIYYWRMKKYWSGLAFILFISVFTVQGQNFMRLTPSDIESLFLKQNLKLIAEQMNIDIADAEIVQAKLWDNPNLSVSGINLWSTKSQRNGNPELSSPLFGNFGKHTQFSVELSQLIQTANKRGKLVARDKISKEIAVQEFETVLRGLKSELRKSIDEIIYCQNYQAVLQKQQYSLDQLIESYRKQVAQGNIAKSELLRLQSSLLELENEINENNEDLNGKIKTLKSLLSIDPLINIEVEEISSGAIDPDSLILAHLLSQSIENRPELKINKLQTKYFEKSLAYEKAQRVPDITLSANYDRFGGVWKDFVGFGISFDLPFLNRNQGTIKAAGIARDQNLYMEKLQINETGHEVVEAYNNYSQAYLFYQKINKNELLSDLDNMLDIYTRNLINKNISMVEFIDFMDAYKSNKQTVLAAEKKMKLQFEDLQYVVGTELKK